MNGVHAHRKDLLWQRVAIATPYLWLLLFFLVPFAIILKISLADPVVAQPPFTPSFDASGGLAVTLDNFTFLLTDKLYAITYLRSVLMALIATLLCLALGFPMAYGIARARAEVRGLLLLLVVLPFWISFLLRVYAWMGLMNNNGTINNLLLGLGIVDAPVQFMYTDFAVFVGLTYSYLPFMILPLYATLERMDEDLVEAALDLRRDAETRILGRDLAARPAGCDRRLPAGVHPRHRRVRDSLPARRTRCAADRPGAVRRILCESRLAAGLRGRRRAPVVARDSHRHAATQPGEGRGGHRVRRSSRFVLSTLAFGYAFLYVPLVLVVVYSFNNSRISTVWGGFSTRWYAALLQNEQVLDATWLSLRIAVASATLATILGTMAGLALARFGRFRGRTLFSGMITSPMVMPEVITGLSLLLLFVSLQQLTGWPSQRGFSTITIAHTTFSMAYVAVIVRSRLAAMDESLEEAAMDLGGRPLRVVFDVTLPLIAPAMVAGWLLAFTLSLDDLVIASFVSGPGSSTLPMYIFSKVKLGVSPDINALATLIIVFVSVGVLLAWLATRRASRAT